MEGKIRAETLSLSCSLLYPQHREKRNGELILVNFKKKKKLYNIVLVLPYIDMNPPRVYTCSPSWTPLPPPSPHHPSGSSQCTSPEHPVSCIEPGLAIHFTYDIIHVSMPYNRFLLVKYSIHSINSVYMSISISQFILPSFVLGIHMFVGEYTF